MSLDPTTFQQALPHRSQTPSVCLYNASHVDQTQLPPRTILTFFITSLSLSLDPKNFRQAVSTLIFPRANIPSFFLPLPLFIFLSPSSSLYLSFSFHLSPSDGTHTCLLSKQMCISSRSIISHAPTLVLMFPHYSIMGANGLK